MTGDGIDQLRFLPIDEAAVTHWRRPSRFDFLHRLRSVPIADTELLHMSHYSPIVIAVEDEEPTVRALVDPAMLRLNPVGEDGVWRRPYVPIALRNLPFWPGAGRDAIGVAPELLGEASDGAFALMDPDGKPTEHFAAIMTWTERLRIGMRRLSEAARFLIAADVVAPLVAERPGALPKGAADYLTASPSRMSALDASRACAFAADGCMPLDLVAACLFSRRLLAQSVKIAEGARVAVGAVSSGGEAMEPLAWMDAPLRLDESPLFSMEQMTIKEEGARAAGAVDA
ncbi:MAG: hypothetical protein BGP06_03750 [Rhizobiales bacterium 65-9]|nr:SapC family protein [Hyphomicrobiales bacterium]OJY36041.1 MAG: hypothetical protein BGP06_03750 [Rhizobiales bacterium 65-9]